MSGPQIDREVKNIVLIGFMGTGKTSVGLKLAQKLGMQFIDTDDVIEAENGMKISEIFAKNGEEYFRDLETDLVRRICKLCDLVIATGGGVVKRTENIDNLRSNGLLIWLDASPEVILNRTSGSNHRPLLQVPDPLDQICKMLKERERFYSQADYRIDTSNLTVDEVVDKIIEIFKGATKIGRDSC